MSVGPDPVAEAGRWLDGAPIDRSTSLFVIGLGAGHLLTALERRGWRGRVVALEPAGHARIGPMPGVTVLLGPDYDGLDEVVLALEPDAEHPVVVGDPAGMATGRDEAVRATRRVAKAWFGARANQEARRKYAGPYLLNTLRNVPAIASEGNVSSLVQAFARCPAVVAAAGPSLDDNLREVVANRDRVVLIAVDTALRPLLAAGVAPDLVVALDPGEVNASHLVDLPACPDTYLVAEGSLDSEALGHFAGRTLFFRVADHHPWPWLRSLGLDRQPLRAWGSVLTTAFDLALQMGCDPIAFAGADLAFTHGRPYARGTTFEEEWRRARAWGDAIETSWAQRLAAWPETHEHGVHGGPVRTAPHLVAFRDWIVAAAAKAPGRTVVNTTAAGILAGRGIAQATLSHTLAARRPLAASVPAALARLRSRDGSPHVWPRPSPSRDVRRMWAAFAGVPDAAIDDALSPGTPAPALLGQDAFDSHSVGAEGPSAGDADAAYLTELSRTTTLRLHALTTPEQDLLGELRGLTRDLRADEALVVADEVGLAMGAQVRQAVDALLCERPDLWLEYRRFVDHASRLAVLRGAAARHTPPAHEADAAKWDSAHQAIATRLAPFIAHHVRPRSVVDVGCGAGHWLQALLAHGVTDVEGVTASTTPLTAMPDLGRRFDACLCLEVAHRFDPAGQEAVIAACTRASDVVVFSSQLPGAPDAGPHARPLQYWAAAFWRHGFVLDDRLRQAIEQTTHFPQTVFDCMVTFRRGPGAPGAAASETGLALQAHVLESAARLHDAYTQKIWWAVAALDREAPAAPPTEMPRADLVTWVVPTSRLLRGSAGVRVFRCRTDIARWYLTHPAATLHVVEDDRPLPEAAFAALPDVPGGAWARWRDEIHVRASDGTDPRTNRRRYGLRVPTHVAWAESQPVRDALAHGL